jgi:hypothetical protein
MKRVVLRIVTRRRVMVGFVKIAFFDGVVGIVMGGGRTIRGVSFHCLYRKS